MANVFEALDAVWDDFVRKPDGMRFAVSYLETVDRYFLKASQGLTTEGLNQFNARAREFFLSKLSADMIPIVSQDRQAVSTIWHRMASGYGRRSHGAFDERLKFEGLSLNDQDLLSDRDYQKYIELLAKTFCYEDSIDAFLRRYAGRSAENLLTLNISTLRTQVYSLLRCSRLNEAEELARELVRVAPDSPHFLTLLGAVLLSSHPSEARQYLRESLRHGNRDNVVVQYIYLSLLQEDASLDSMLDDINLLSQNKGSQPQGGDLKLLHSSIANRRGDAAAALARFNEHLAVWKFSPVSLIDEGAGFTIDNLQVTGDLPAIEKGPKVSVLMTTYNSEEHIETAVRSVVEQNWRNLELLIVDDCSTDGTRDILAKLANADQRIRVFHNVANAGTYASKNLALLHATGEFITCHDSDDWSHPQKISRQLQSLLGDSRYQASISYWARFDERGLFEPLRFGLIMHDNPSSVLYRRSVVTDIGYYDSVRTAADREHLHRIYHTYGRESVYTLKACAALGRIRSDSLTRSSETGFTAFGSSPHRVAYWKSWAAWHLNALNTESAMYIPYPPKGDERPFDAPVRMLVDLAGIHENIDRYPVT
jgi:Glycosyl transferase family 2